MRDQASTLRKLVLDTAREEHGTKIRTPRVIAIAGGRPGVGVTTLALNLSTALTARGLRVLLVDTDLHPTAENTSLADYCQIVPADTIADVLSFRRDVHEIVHSGPDGIQIVPGSPVAQPTVSSTALDRLLNQCRAMGRHADLVILDVGSYVDSSMQQCWEQADELVMVTTPQPNAIMDTYATLKSITPTPSQQPIYCTVNQTSSNVEESQTVFERLDRSCRRFLQFGMHALPAIPRASELQTWTVDNTRSNAADCPATTALRLSAEMLATPNMTHHEAA